MAASQLRDFMDRGYAPRKIVVAVAGKVDANEVSDAIAELFASVTERKPPRLKAAPKPSKTRVKLLGKRTEQAHVCIGWRGVPQVHPDKYTLDMLNAILGEGMSSRLFLDRVRTVEEVCDIIDSVSAEDIQRAAQQYLRPELSYVAAVGPRAAVATVRAPVGAEVVMEIAS